jgi:hypothetical protein
LLTVIVSFSKEGIPSYQSIEAYAWHHYFKKYCMPQWLIYLSAASLIVAGICFLIIVIDISTGRWQPMWIMNVVWPVTALYAGPLALWAYWRVGRATPDDEDAGKSFWQSGMYGWMAVAMFLIFGHGLYKTGVVFWFIMQIGMLVGFITSYPMNWGLVRGGIKEAM